MYNHTISVQKQGGVRLDVYLSSTLGLSKGLVAKLFKNKKIRLAGERAKPVQRVLGDEILAIYEKESVLNLEGVTVKEGVSQEVKELDPSLLLHKDEKVWVFNKPTGWAVQPGRGVKLGYSVIERLHQAFPEVKENLKLVHRLDVATSGLLLLSTSTKSLEFLLSGLKRHRFQKTYWALVKGVVEESAGSIRVPLLRIDSKFGSNVEVGENNPEASKAHTEWKCLERGEDWSLLEVKPLSGRMHQIRVHLASIGHPIVGDNRYGDFEFNRVMKDKMGTKRMFLHSFRLKVPKYEIPDAPVSKQWEEAIEKLKA
jgi:23S rRNA pseudouridine955/2504/2580 synthase